MAYVDPEKGKQYRKEYDQRPEVKARARLKVKNPAWPSASKESIARYQKNGAAKRKARITLNKIQRPERIMVNFARTRAKRKGLPFCLEEKDIIMPAVCPILGTAFKHGDYKALPTSPTLDRIDSSKGYEVGNVWVISHRANRMKQDSTLIELKTILKYMESHGCL